MKHTISPLLWLCTALSAALGVFAWCDPTGVYASYRAELRAGDPPIAAVFTAARDGVYPWSHLSADIEPSDTGSSERPDTNPAEQAVPEQEPSMDAKEPGGEALPPSPGPSEEGTTPVPSETVVEPPEDTLPGGADATLSPEPQPPAQEEPADVPEASSETGFVTVDASYFDDALFIGDSHTEGLYEYGDLRNATYYFKRGLTVWTVLDKAFIPGENGRKLTIPQALETQQFGKIYIMLGINEIGDGDAERFAAQYGEVVQRLRALQPEALIYIQAIFHTTEEKSETSYFKNEEINRRNEAISRLADGEHILFVDCNPVFDNSSGTLDPEYSGDGVHVMAPYYKLWRDYLFTLGRSL